jgi:hypothetical protein
VIVAGSGFVSPLSNPARVRFDTPLAIANLSWDQPTMLRAARTCVARVASSVRYSLAFTLKLLHL